MKEVVVLGSSGFVGSCLAAAMRATHRVHGVDCMSGSETQLHVDLMDEDGWGKLPKSADVVINATGIVGVQPDVPERYYVLVNSYMPLRAGRYAATVGAHFIHLSTAGVYGFRDELSTETTPVNPQDIYTLTKYQGELACAHLLPKSRLLILRLNFPYGPGQKKGLFPTLIGRILNGESVILHTEDGRPRISPIHIEDLCALVLRAINKKVIGVYNCGGTEHYSILEISEMTGTLSGRKVVFSRGGSPCSDLMCDSKPLYTACEYRPTLSLRERLGALLKGCAEVRAE